MSETYIVAAIVYLMARVKSPWWVIAIFIALIVSDFVLELINVIREDKREKNDDKKRNV